MKKKYTQTPQRLGILLLMLAAVVSLPGLAQDRKKVMEPGLHVAGQGGNYETQHVPSSRRDYDVGAMPNPNQSGSSTSNQTEEEDRAIRAAVDAAQRLNEQQNKRIEELTQSLAHSLMENIKKKKGEGQDSEEHHHDDEDHHHDDDYGYEDHHHDDDYGYDYGDGYEDHHHDAFDHFIYHLTGSHDPLGLHDHAGPVGSAIVNVIGVPPPSVWVQVSEQLSAEQ